MRNVEDVVFHLLGRVDNVAKVKSGRHRNAALTSSQYAALAALEDGGVDAISEISASTKIDRSTTSDVVERLVQKGFINRKMYDQKSKAITITKAGRKAMELFSVEVQKREAALLANVGDKAAQEQFMATLTKFVHSLETRSA
jgi:DNA-binding MarR family transcriptional regulator